jgi:hypothetical protein
MDSEPMTARDWIDAHAARKECTICGIKFVPVQKRERRCDQCKPLQMLPGSQRRKVRRR